ncbi:signal peptidase I [uncultured Catenibacterium sp.]|uniref:signal peptidase I n=1 Tax=uncultured Catenibacterium sp. TaxID=286142 RepID=UPI0025F1F545|nr:signal peptidase I [uncultured Catenibacterium sp.]
MKRKITFISLIVICIIMFLITTFCPFYTVEGSSMSPTLSYNDLVCIKKTKSFKQGDLVAINYNNKLLIRRVIALSGDKVNIDADGYVFVNDKKLEENYLTSRKDNPLRDEVFPCIVPSEKVFVLGDNRAQAIDSRMRDLGCIDQDKIIGKVVMKVYPITRFTIY